MIKYFYSIKIILQNIPGCQFIPGYPDCIYLDTEENKWSTGGCVVRFSTGCQYLDFLKHVKDSQMMNVL